MAGEEGGLQLAWSMPLADELMLPARRDRQRGRAQMECLIDALDEGVPFESALARAVPQPRQRPAEEAEAPADGDIALTAV